VLAAAAAATGGCLSPGATRRTVFAYDRVLSETNAELLLLNIARAHEHRPLHFMSVQSIAATFTFTVTPSILGTVAGAGTANAITPGVLGTFTENPTVTIVPIQGEEFTKRVLTPIDESKFHFLLHQGLDLTMVLRLLGRGLLIEDHAELGFLDNHPAKRRSYSEFRRRVAHLAELDRRRKLWIGPLVFNDEQPLPEGGRPPTPAEVLLALDKGYRILKRDTGYVLTRPVLGRLAITNYDPALVPSEQIRLLNEEAKRFPPHHVLVDIRQGKPGGNYPLRGRLVLRSFNRMLVFVARGIDETPEYGVPQDARTPPYALNEPPQTLTVVRTQRRPSRAAYSVSYQGSYYSIPEARDSALPGWDLQAFRLLSHVFQMTVTDVAKVPSPPVTIAK
jgi:hypothetical protein